MIELKSKISEYGDYQTPDYFADKVCDYLKNKIKIDPEILIEPTFGIGNFIDASVKVFKNIKKIYGIEINKKYFDITKNRFDHLTENILINLYHHNFFQFNFSDMKDEISKDSDFLIVGNPPWVTNSQLGSIGGLNLPLKNNFKNHKGLDALTGKGNFDITESIILKLLSEFNDYNGYVALLCKNTVAKNIVKEINNYNFKVSNMKFLRFDALKVFEVNCEAGLFVMKLGKQSFPKEALCDLYELNDSKNKIKTFGWINDKFVSDSNSYNHEIKIDGHCPYEWRQGVKHDCAKVMELTYDSNQNTFLNGYKKKVEIEEECIYPLLKSSDLKGGTINKTRKFVIITQKKARQETDPLKDNFPKLWKYLNEYAIYLDRRKSSIYKNSPRFSIFGIGPYSFKKYKVVVSGFYKEPVFSLAFSEKPIMLDDTCYFIGFEDYQTAMFTMILLNHTLINNFLKSIAFLESKRPFTKEILMRIDLKKAIEHITFNDLLNHSNVKQEMILNITKQNYEKYKNRIKEEDLRLF